MSPRLIMSIPINASQIWRSDSVALIPFTMTLFGSMTSIAYIGVSYGPFAVCTVTIPTGASPKRRRDTFTDHSGVCACVPERRTRNGISRGAGKRQRRRNHDVRPYLTDYRPIIFDDCAHTLVFEKSANDEANTRGFSSLFGMHLWTANVPNGCPRSMALCAATMKSSNAPITFPSEKAMYLPEYSGRRESRLA